VTPDDKADLAQDREANESDEANESADHAGEAVGESGESTESKADDKARPRAVRQTLLGVRSHLVAIVLAAALIASASVAAWLYFSQYRPGQQTNDAAAKVALEAAKSGTVSLLSYSPESLDKDFANAKSHLTGDFLSYYTQFTQQVVTPAAEQKAVKTTAAVVRAAVSELQPDSAVVLVFINQNTTSKENPDGAFAASAVKVGMKKINGTWLISAFDPV
jgi:Mce-associated membrane protein